MQAVLWLWPAMYRSIYGRFLLLQLDSSSSVALLSVLLSIMSVASRLCSRQARQPAYISVQDVTACNVCSAF
jgi:hypothetical protein